MIRARGTMAVLIGIAVLCGMFLAGQESWPPPTQPCEDVDGDGFGSPAAEACPYGALDCDDDPSDDPAACATCSCGDLLCNPCARCVHPGVIEGWMGIPVNGACQDGVDNDCDGYVDGEEPGCLPCATASDCDDGNPCTNQTCVLSRCHFTYNEADCDDGRSCTVNDRCASGFCTGDPPDGDGDGFGSDACGGDDCDDGNAQVNPGEDEAPYGSPVCTDGLDNDCDGLPDAGDPGCAPCTHPSQCDDANPCTDDLCIDSVCQHVFNNLPCDDGDACTMDDTCAWGTCIGYPLDADGDGYVSEGCAGNDCDDGDPAVHPGATEGPWGDPTCGDGADNDCNGFADGADPQCQAPPDPSIVTPASVTETAVALPPSGSHEPAVAFRDADTARLELYQWTGLYWQQRTLDLGENLEPLVDATFNATGQLGVTAMDSTPYVARGITGWYSDNRIYYYYYNGLFWTRETIAEYRTASGDIDRLKISATPSGGPIVAFTADTLLSPSSYAYQRTGPNAWTAVSLPPFDLRIVDFVVDGLGVQHLLAERIDGSYFILSYWRDEGAGWIEYLIAVDLSIQLHHGLDLSVGPDGEVDVLYADPSVRHARFLGGGGYPYWDFQAVADYGQVPDCGRIGVDAAGVVHALLRDPSTGELLFGPNTGPSIWDLTRISLAGNDAGTACDMDVVGDRFSVSYRDNTEGTLDYFTNLP